MTPNEPGPHESLDLLAGTWRIFQLRRGHRFSTDDLVTAWEARRAAPAFEPLRLLDLGAGIGSVGLLTLHGLPPSATLTTVEVQEVSYGLQARTLAYNGLLHRVTARLGDLRHPAAVPERSHFHLITGSPPYIPPGRGVLSPVPQRAGARIELRGDVFDYARTAAGALSPGGAFVFCHAASDPRPEQAVHAAGLVVRRRLDVVFRGDQPPLIAVFTCAHEGHRDDPAPFAIRGPDGRWTEPYLDMRRQMGATDLRLE